MSMFHCRTDSKKSLARAEEAISVGTVKYEVSRNAINELAKAEKRKYVAEKAKNDTQITQESKEAECQIKV